ncbi:MAG TPA: hypothetical protein VNE39_06690 [Planctomycetota bacterium]|nr:hypothetical protein [Planctomycetota bacterium]
MGDVSWSPPPDIRQDFDDTCWAAVIEAFCAASPGRPKVKQGDIVDQYGSQCYSRTDGTMTRKGLHLLFSDVRFGLKSTEVAPGAFSALLVSQKLGRGLVPIGYWESRIGGWHVALIYGIAGSTVSYQDPDFAHGGRRLTSTSHFRPASKGNLIVAWRAW